MCTTGNLENLVPFWNHRTIRIRIKGGLLSVCRIFDKNFKNYLTLARVDLGEKQAWPARTVILAWCTHKLIQFHIDTCLHTIFYLWGRQNHSEWWLSFSIISFINLYSSKKFWLFLKKIQHAFLQLSSQLWTSQYFLILHARFLIESAHKSAVSWETEIWLI